jgi:hypothetical protein
VLISGCFVSSQGLSHLENSTSTHSHQGNRRDLAQNNCSTTSHELRCPDADGMKVERENLGYKKANGGIERRNAISTPNR